MGLLGSLIKSKTAPIGVDIGSSAIKLAQVAWEDGKPRVVGAAYAQVPTELRADPKARVEHFIETVPGLLSKGDFRGRRAIIGLPAWCMHLQRVRVPMLAEQEIKQAIQFELMDKLPFHPSRALIRHLVAGEVYEDNDRRAEVIVLAARRDLSDTLIAAAGKAKLQVVGVNAEPLAIAASLAPAQVQSPATGARAYIDIGSTSTRVYIAAARKIQFARAVAVGVTQLDIAAAHALRVNQDQARQVRLKMASEAAVPAKSAASG